MARGKLRRALGCIPALLYEAQAAQAEHELGLARRIMRRKWLLFLVLLPALAGVAAVAGAHSGALPEMLGGDKAYGPAFLPAGLFGIAVLVGFCAGLITGCIGAGGGFVVTPALMSFGIRGIVAVGTDMFHIFAKAIMGTTIHKKLGNISWPLGITFVIGSFAGVNLGAQVNRGLYERNQVLSDTVITAVYIGLLGLLSCVAVYDYIRLGERRPSEKPGGAAGMTALAVRLQRIRIKPLLRFDEDLGGRTISAWLVIIVGFVVGFISTLIGVGGGFVTFPAYVYILGVSSFTTVGTDIMQIIFTAGYASVFQYAVRGFVLYSLAMSLLVGSLAGIQIGAITTRVVKGRTIRGFYAITIIAGFVNRLCALPRKLDSLGYISISETTGRIMENVGTVVFFMLIGFFALWVLYEFLKNLADLRTVDDIARESH